MYLDLSPRKRFTDPQVIKRQRHYQPVTPLRRRIALYGIAFILAGSLVVWSTGQVEAISSQAIVQQQQLEQSTERRLIDALIASEVSAFDLADYGFAFLEAEEITDASIYLQAAAAKDANYRDAALYAGYTELARADEFWTTDSRVAERHTKTAVTYLELARSIDPIHGYTFDLLSLAYHNLGNYDLEEDANTKAQLFAQS